MLTVFHYHGFYVVFLLIWTGYSLCLPPYLILLTRRNHLLTHEPNELGDVEELTPKLANHVNVLEKMGKLFFIAQPICG